ncbi:MAG TPA: serine/threonine-protein phosphatase [Verrucomicrobia bacterium]|nr:serine/threonine-protein phosphatase [Verrucomicrobiota bacterium]
MWVEANKKEAFGIRAAGGSDTGCVRIRNEDAYLVDIEHGIFIVADGLGGHSAGDKAAQMAKELLPGIIHRRLVEAPPPCSSGDRMIGAILAKALEELSHLIRDAGNRQVECKGMGTTVVAAVFTPRHLHLAHLGDSRAYLLRGDCMRRLTEDHSIVALLVRQGEITPQEAETHPARGRLSRFAGMEGDVPAATITIDLEAGDRFLLCTDGVWGELSDAKIREILMQGNTPEVTCGILIEAGKQAGGQDNLTSVVVDVEEAT